MAWSHSETTGVLSAAYWLMGHPDDSLWDEPADGLDPAARLQLYQLIRRETNERRSSGFHVCPVRSPFWTRIESTNRRTSSNNFASSWKATPFFTTMLSCLQLMTIPKFDAQLSWPYAITPFRAA